MTQKVAIITAASSGMGAGSARELANQGYAVVLMSRSEAIHDVAKELGGTAMQGSVTNPDDLQALVDLAMNTHGRIDAVVLNTGHPPKADLLEISDEQWQMGFDMMLMNVVRLTRIITPIMQKQGGGVFVNITAFGAAEPNLGFPVSCAIRSAVSAYTKLFSDRYANENIRMNSVLPGYIETWEMSQEAVEAQIPAKRMGKVTEIAKTVAFLASEGAGYISGQNIIVDGGLSYGL